MEPDTAVEIAKYDVSCVWIEGAILHLQLSDEPRKPGLGQLTLQSFPNLVADRCSFCRRPSPGSARLDGPFQASHRTRLDRLTALIASQVVGQFPGAGVAFLRLL